MKSLFASAGRVLLTLVSLLVAIAVGWQLWSYYMLEPWTRDGRVRADVVTVAADVSGLVSDVFVHDNEKVSKGQKLFRSELLHARAVDARRPCAGRRGHGRGRRFRPGQRCLCSRQRKGEQGPEAVQI